MTEGTTESFVVADLSAEAEAQPEKVPANRVMQAKRMKGDVENRREVNAPMLVPSTDYTHGGKDIEDREELAIWSKDSFGAGPVTCPCEQWRVAGRICWIGKKLGDEAAADADGIFAELSGPDAFEAYADGREYGHVENGQQSVGDVLGA